MSKKNRNWRRLSERVKLPPIDIDLFVGVMATLCGFEHIGMATMSQVTLRKLAEEAAKHAGKPPPVAPKPFVLSENFKVIAALDGITVEVEEPDRECKCLGSVVDPDYHHPKCYYFKGKKDDRTEK